MLGFPCTYVLLWIEAIGFPTFLGFYSKGLGSEGVRFWDSFGEFSKVGGPFFKGPYSKSAVLFWGPIKGTRI